MRVSELTEPIGITIRFEYPEETCHNCGRIHRGDAVSICGADGTERWRGCGECWSALISSLPDRVTLQQEVTRLRHGLQRLASPEPMSKFIALELPDRLAYAQDMLDGGEP